MVAPVANTITSTTSATQDLEVFKNYPSEKNLNSLKDKYGSQEGFFKQVAAEGYKEGFKGKELNLPATQMLDQTAMNQFLDPSGISQRIQGGDPGMSGLESVKDVADYSVPHTMSKSDAYGISNQVGNRIPSEVSQGSSMAGGFDLNYPQHLTDKRYNQKRREGLQGLTSNEAYQTGDLPQQSPWKQDATESGISQFAPHLAAPEFKGQGKKWDEFQTELYWEQKRLDEAKKQKEGIKQLDELAYRGERPEKEENPWANKRLRELKQKLDDKKLEISEGAIIPPENLTEIFGVNISKLDQKGMELLSKMKLTLPADDVDEIMEFIDTQASGYVVPSRFDQKDKHEVRKNKKKLAKEFGLSTSDLLLWEARQTKKSAGELIKKIGDGKKRAKTVGLEVNSVIGPNDDQYDEIKTRERILKEPGGQRELDKYVLDYQKRIAQAEKDKKDKDKVTKVEEIPQGISVPDWKVKAKQEFTQDDAYTLMDKAETKEGLGDGERGDLIENLKDKGVKTKGLTDKNLLLIAMGLGMMASDKPGLQGVGAGALEGLKLVAPLMKEKSSDIQMITVKNDEGENVIVRYNKKKGTYEETGLKSGTTSKNTTLEKINTISKLAKIPDDQVATAMYNNLTQSKGKPREEQITSMMSILTRTIKGMTLDSKELREIAETIVDENMSVDLSGTKSELGL